MSSKVWFSPAMPQMKEYGPRAHARVDGPGGGDHGLLVGHDDVAGLQGLAVEVEHAGRLVHAEVEVDLHAALVGVGRVGVPHAARLQDGQAHHQLAAPAHRRVDVLVDRAHVAGLGAAEPARVGVGPGDVRHRVGGVGRAAHEVELGRLGRVLALEADGLDAHAHVQAVAVGQGVGLAVQQDAALAAQVDHAQFPAVQEVRACRTPCRLPGPGPGWSARRRRTPPGPRGCRPA